MSTEAPVQFDDRSPQGGLSRLLAAANALIDDARAQDLRFKLCGGLACWQCASDFARQFALRGSRRYSDMDFAAYYTDHTRVLQLLERHGFAELASTATVPGVRRTKFRSPHSGLHGDVFYDALEFCHTVDIRGRIEVEEQTLPIAELLLQKLQIVKLVEKDVIDIQMLLVDHEFSVVDTHAINSPRIALLCGSDWGLHRTVTLNIAKVRAATSIALDLPNELTKRVDEQLNQLERVLREAPKSLLWRLRAIPGAHFQWYETVDDGEVTP